MRRLSITAYFVHLDISKKVILKNWGNKWQTTQERFPSINVWGGCCGTDYDHLDQIATAVLAVNR